MISKDIKQKVKKAIGKYTHRQIAKMYNVGVGTVSMIRNEGKAPEIKRLKNGDHPYELSIPSMRKSDIVWLWKHRCKHKERYLNHPKCFFDECGGVVREERVGFFDIEATNLKANFGVVICYCIKIGGTDEIISRCVTPKEMKKDLDKKVVEQLIDDLWGFDRIIGHYSSRFDLPFVRSRALKHRLHFPDFGTIWQSDTWRIARQRLCLSSNRLKTIGEFLDIETEKTPITSEHWLGALTGNQESLDYIVNHCERDVIILEEVYNRIKDYAFKSNTSI